MWERAGIPSRRGLPDTRLESWARLVAMAEIDDSVRELVPMLNVPDVALAAEWYEKLGFVRIRDHAPDEGRINWAFLQLDDVKLMLNAGGARPVAGAAPGRGAVPVHRRCGRALRSHAASAAAEQRAPSGPLDRVAAVPGLRPCAHCVRN